MKLPKLSLCINTRNEGPDVLQTIISFKNAYSGPFEAVVVDDASEDGSCDGLWKGLARFTKASCSETQEGTVRYHRIGTYCDLIVIRNEVPVGCGKAKAMAVAAATGDVIIHADGHCRVIRGPLDAMVKKAFKHDYILCPGVTPLHCAIDAQPAQDEHYKEGNTSYGGRITCKPKKGKNDEEDHDMARSKGARVYGLWKPKEAAYARRSATWWAIFMFSKRTLKRIGGWNEYPGIWGSQEIGLALRAWFADVPIYTVRDVICGHRYQTHTSYKARQRELKAKGIKHYDTKARMTCANHMYAHQVVFDPETMEKLWRPLWRGRYDPQRIGAAHGILAESKIELQSAHFRKNSKKRTDADFFAEFWPDVMDFVPKQGAVVPKVDTILPKEAQLRRDLSTSDITAVLLQYKRPLCMQQCVNALRRGGIENIWVWCQNGAAPPEGATRVFTDSDNGRTWPRWELAASVPTKYVLHIDDDAEITAEGASALTEGIRRYSDRPVGLFGFSLKPPFTDYLRRQYAWCHEIKADTEVDILYPKGYIWPRDLMQEVFGRADLWQRMRAECNGVTRGDDLIAYVALRMMGKPCPIVVKTNGKGVIEHFTTARRESGGDSLDRQPEYKLKRATLPIWKAMGYLPIGGVK